MPSPRRHWPTRRDSAMQAEPRCCSCSVSPHSAFTATVSTGRHALLYQCFQKSALHTDAVKMRIAVIIFSRLTAHPKRDPRILAVKCQGQRATRRPEIDVSVMAARHSRVTSSTMFSTRTCPQANWSCKQSRNQRAFGLASTRIGAGVPTARHRAQRLRTVSASSR